MVNFWLAKQEPKSYNFSTLKIEKKTTWDGVHNNLALKHLNRMKKGDSVLFYHSGEEKKIVGVMKIISDPYPNPDEINPRYVVVDVKYKSQLKKPVSLEEIKKLKVFKNWELVRISRLSIMPVTKKIWETIIQMSK